MSMSSSSEHTRQAHAVPKQQSLDKFDHRPQATAPLSARRVSTMFLAGLRLQTSLDLKHCRTSSGSTARDTTILSSACALNERNFAPKGGEECNDDCCGASTGVELGRTLVVE